VEPTVDALRRIWPNTPRQEPLELLVGLEPTSVLEERLQQTRERLGAVLMHFAEDEIQPEAPPRRIRDLDEQIRHIVNQVKLGRRRDLLELAFGCWCLGLGGRGVVALADAHYGAVHIEGDQVIGFREYCQCPVGLAAKAESMRLFDLGRRQLEAQRQARLWRRVPVELRDVSLESFPTDVPEQWHALTVVRDWLPLKSPWLLLWGSPGRMKSGLAVAAARETGAVWSFVPVPDLLYDLRATFDREQRSRDVMREAEVLGSVYDVELLILDDLGKQKATDWADEVIYQVIAHRDSDGRRTIITSNKGPGAIEAHLGDSGPAIMSRILGRTAGKTFALEMGGPDMRTERYL
jgi:DNA replication protein DnaC